MNDPRTIAAAAIARALEESPMSRLSCLQLRVHLADAAANRAFVIAERCENPVIAEIWRRAAFIRSRVAANLERRA